MFFSDLKSNDEIKQLLAQNGGKEIALSGVELFVLLSTISSIHDVLQKLALASAQQRTDYNKSLETLRKTVDDLQKIADSGKHFEELIIDKLEE